jgi:flavin-dependent dehydrogenase
MGPTTVRSFDVTVIGAGLAGIAASLHLTNAGFRVVCIEPEAGLREPVGESLDWSSPALLDALDLPLNGLIDNGIATYKRGVTMQLSHGGVKHFRPPPWVGRAPFHIALDTIHVDRVRLDRALQDLAVARGVTIIHDKASAVEKQGMRIVSVQTSSGARFDSPWFIDASGSLTSFLAREFHLAAVAYGPRKVCLWSYFTAPLAHEGTTIYMDPVQGEYQDWIWEIPVGPNTLSVGYITTGEAVKKKREQGLRTADIFSLQLARFPRLAGLAPRDAGIPPRVTSFNCRTYRGVTGPNWIIAGEAASMVDPITSNGVTSALRHAQEASALIVASKGKSELPYMARKSYSMRVLQLGRFFNSGIEWLVYDWQVRDRLGIERAATIYTDAAWSVNALYSRLRPRGILSTATYGALLNVVRAGAWMLYRLCASPGPKRIVD